MDNQLSPTAFRFLLVTSVVVAGCTDLSVSVVPVAKIEVVPPSVSLEAGESVELRATPTDEDGNALLGRGVEWHIGDPSKAIVSSGGVVYALESGVTIAEARSEGVVGMADILVVSPEPKPPGPGEEGGDGDNDADDGDSSDGDGDDGDSDGGSSDGDGDDGEGDTGGKGGNGKGDERGGKKK